MTIDIFEHAQSRSTRRFASIIIGLGCAALLSGCAAKPLEVGSITRIKPVAGAGAGGQDVYAEQRKSNPSAVPQYAGDQLVEVRSYEDIPDKGRVEISGATCELVTARYKAEATTPAKVLLPLYRVSSSPLSVTCKKPGYAQKLETVSPFDLTQAQRLDAGANAGLAGLAVMALYDAAVDSEGNDWKYPPVTVVMKKSGIASSQ